MSEHEKVNILMVDDQPAARLSYEMILSLNLPGMDGRELLPMIKGDEHLKSIPVMIVTTSRNPREVEWCYQPGANSYQVKVIGCDQFRSAMRLLVEYALTVCVLPATADRERSHTG